VVKIPCWACDSAGGHGVLHFVQDDKVSRFKDDTCFGFGITRVSGFRMTRVSERGFVLTDSSPPFDAAPLPSLHSD